MHVVAMLGLISQDAIKGLSDRLLKRAAMVFMVHSRHSELFFTYWCS